MELVVLEGTVDFQSAQIECFAFFLLSMLILANEPQDVFGLVGAVPVQFAVVPSPKGDFRKSWTIKTWIFFSPSKLLFSAKRVLLMKERLEPLGVASDFLPENFFALS